MKPTVLDARHLDKAHGDPRHAAYVLRNVSLQLHAGERLALLGRSGSGKSSLLHILGALDPFYRGTVRILGEDLAALGDRARSRLRSLALGFVFQSYNLIGHLDALANVVLPATFAGRHEDRARGRTLLEEVGLGDRAHQVPRALSGGERQRVAIARALYLGPRIVLCDEPTGNLDATSAGQVLDLFDGLAARQVACIMATHDPAVAARCHRQLTVVDGRLVP